MAILRLFSDCDEFGREFLPRRQAYPITEGTGPRPGESRLSRIDAVTPLVRFQPRGRSPPKPLPPQPVGQDSPGAFPPLSTSPRFVELEAQALLPLAPFLPPRLGRSAGLSFSDSTPLQVGHHLRSKSHK